MKSKGMKKSFNPIKKDPAMNVLSRQGLSIS